MIKIILACIASCYFGMAIMSCFAVNSYNKGYKDGKGEYVA